MAIWNRNKSNPIEPAEPLDVKTLNEAGTFMSKSGNVQMYNFIQGLQYLDTNFLNNNMLIERMLNDSIISSAIDLWMEDALQRDPLDNKLFQISVESPGDNVEEELSKGLTKELTSFLTDDLEIDKSILEIAKDLLIYGQVPVRLGFINPLEDEELVLHESVNDKVNDTWNASVLLKVKDFLDPRKANTFESVSEMYNLQTKLINENYLCDYHDYVSKNNYNIKAINSAKNYKQALNEEYQNLVDELSNMTLLEGAKNNKDRLLKEATLNDIKQMMRGRWYIQTFGHGNNIFELKTKQKTVAFVDRDNQNAFIEPDKIIMFSNNSLFVFSFLPF